VTLHAVLKVSLEYVALPLVYCCLGLWTVLKVSLRCVTLALVYYCLAGMWLYGQCMLIFLYTMCKSRVVASSCGVDKSSLGLEINNKCVMNGMDLVN
jgi:hypothetical protein